MASIRKRNGKFQVQVRIGQENKSKSFMRLSDAREWARITELGIVQSQHLGKKYKPSNFQEILHRYLDEVTILKRSAINEAIVIRALLQFDWVNKPLEQLSMQDLTAFRDKRLQTVKPATLKRQLNILKHACAIASNEWNWETPLNLLKRLTLPKNPAHLVKRITPEQEANLYKELGKSRNSLMLPLVKLAIVTGMRRGEILSLRNDDIDLTSMLIYVRQSKNGKPRSIPLTKASASILESLLENDTSYIFPISGNAVRIAFTNARNRAGLKHIRFHDLRHEAISRLTEKGLTAQEIALLSGHQQIQTLLEYTHGCMTRIRKAINKKSAG